MDSNWAGEQLQTIRTLMERSALYRRALAPIMLLAGILGVVAAALGLLFHLNSVRAFCGLWLGTAIVAVSGVFVIARRQALKEKETFWSPPTRRVAQALLPPLLAGMFLGAIPSTISVLAKPPDDVRFLISMLSSVVWILLYGCALHSAGFFMPRGIRLFGWLFIVSACILFYCQARMPFLTFDPHYLMGFFFGVLHLAYGAYLYLTERGKNEA
jgi:hypothetical protein